ncbi:lipopolysaccharide biosynthesis protein [Rhodopirellula halodulae]|uniref:lipopolysaccharide biosynthesis protein n=1 Tax=Rhodopirellula halodulae TaxID=2894198 RepID=UPI0032F2CD58|nr:lipopolysaccharide biosynthesis protein [Rhodopirellula sp. JC737]
MSTANSTTESASPSKAFRVDSLAIGMVVMLAMTVLGRGIGFIRGMAFCRLMDDTDVGRWSMAFGFITLITPVMLLGIPGVLPRFTEHFRRRRSLTTFVRRIAIGTLACTSIFVMTMLAIPQWFGWIVFLQPQDNSLIYGVAGAVVGMILYNFVSDLNGSLRQVRMVSCMQFMQGVGFTLLSVAWLLSGGDFTGVVWMFAASCLLACIPGGWSLARSWSSAQDITDLEITSTEPETPQSFGVWDMIRRLAPYATALWLMNLIGNLFELSDRYMILHFIPATETVSAELAGQAAVGQYHSGRIIPMLLLSLGTMIGGVMLPYLSADWEAKRIRAVQDRLRDALLIVSIIFTAGSAVAILLGPWIFGVLLQGRYTDGLTLMPMALCFCTWAALVTVGQNYLWTVEKGKWVPVAMAAGLTSNLLLNAWLLPIYGLQGAVIATMCSHGVVMTGVWLAMIGCGYRADLTMLVLSLLPLTLLTSPAAAFCLAILIAAVALYDETTRNRWLQNVPERLRERLSWT